LSDLTSKFCTAAVFEFLDVICHSKCADIFTISFCSTFHIRSFSGSVVITIRPQAEGTLRTVAILCFTFCRMRPEPKLHMLRTHITSYGHVLSTTIVVLTSQIRGSTMLLLLVVGKEEGCSFRNVYRSCGSEFNDTNTHTGGIIFS
jgi:hypothetical protein